MPLLEIDGLNIVQSHSERTTPHFITRSTLLLDFGEVHALTILPEWMPPRAAILRYLGRKLGWYVGDAAMLARIDLLSDGTEDVRKMLSAIKYSEDSEEVKDARLDAYFADSALGRRWLGFLDKLIAKNVGATSEYAAGTPEPTHADYLLLDLLDYHEAFRVAASAKLFESLPNLVEWRARMLRDRPRLRAYLDGTGRRPP